MREPGNSLWVASSNVSRVANERLGQGADFPEVRDLAVGTRGHAVVSGFWIVAKHAFRCATHMACVITQNYLREGMGKCSR